MCSLVWMVLAALGFGRVVDFVGHYEIPQVELVVLQVVCFRKMDCFVAVGDSGLV